ncbi:MAG: hypothetical protein ABH817_01045, partial [archaeon]
MNKKILLLIIGMILLVGSMVSVLADGDFSCKFQFSKAYPGQFTIEVTSWGANFPANEQVSCKIEFESKMVISVNLIRTRSPPVHRGLIKESLGIKGVYSGSCDLNGNTIDCGSIEVTEEMLKEESQEGIKEGTITANGPEKLFVGDKLEGFSCDAGQLEGDKWSVTYILKRPDGENKRENFPITSQGSVKVITGFGGEIPDGWKTKEVILTCHLSQERSKKGENSKSVTILAKEEQKQDKGENKWVTIPCLDFLKPKIPEGSKIEIKPLGKTTITEFLFTALTALYAISFGTVLESRAGTCSPENPYEDSRCELCEADEFRACTKDRCEILGPNCMAIEKDDGKGFNCFEGKCEDQKLPKIKNMDFSWYVGLNLDIYDSKSVNSNQLWIRDKEMPWNVTYARLQISTENQAKCRYVIDTPEADFAD